MILTDTGPLVAGINRNDPNHGICVDTTRHLPAVSLLTTWCCLTEAMYLLFQAGGFPAQKSLWKLICSERLVLHNPCIDETHGMAELMEQYKDTPMDFADASIVAVAEHLKMKTVFSLDSDFYIYRLKNGSALQVVPSNPA